MKAGSVTGPYEALTLLYSIVSVLTIKAPIILHNLTAHSSGNTGRCHHKQFFLRYFQIFINIRFSYTPYNRRHKKEGGRASESAFCRADGKHDASYTAGGRVVSGYEKHPP